MSGPLQNLYHKRTVAASSSKPCFICYKPVTTVLITPDNRDFFYVCPGHLTDKGFATPVGEPNEKTPEQKAKDEALKAEIELVKKEYEEKMKKRKSKKKPDKDEKEKEAQKKVEEEDAKDAKERDDKIKALEKGTDASSKAPAPTADTGPRVFVLHKNIHQMRTNRIREAQAAKRTREQLKNPGTFPAVPKDL